MRFLGFKVMRFLGFKVMRFLLGTCIKIFSRIRGKDFERSDLFIIGIRPTHFQYDFK